MHRLLFLFLSALALLACEKKPTEAQDMADFTEDTTFQKAHDNERVVDNDRAGSMMNLSVENGGNANVYAVLPAEKPTQYLFVFHEWWGLNENVKAEADRYFEELGGSVGVLALDAYDGKVATSREDAGAFMQAADETRIKAIIASALAYIGPDAKVATVGWCFGGGWSLKAAIQAEAQANACVIYYGMPVKTAAELAPLQAPVLGVFAEKDGWITPEVVTQFEDLSKATGKEVEVQQYDAEHAFANPSSERYNEAAATTANEQVLQFLAKHINN